MDPYLQRQICPNFYTPRSRKYQPGFAGLSSFRLTSSPAHNYVTPGIGQITKLYTFYTPLNHRKPTHAIEKEVTPALNQEGSGTIMENRYN
jgi:hypothetical protein